MIQGGVTDGVPFVDITEGGVNPSEADVIYDNEFGMTGDRLFNRGLISVAESKLGLLSKYLGEDHLDTPLPFYPNFDEQNSYLQQSILSMSHLFSRNNEATTLRFSPDDFVFGIDKNVDISVIYPGLRYDPVQEETIFTLGQPLSEKGVRKLSNFFGQYIEPRYRPDMDPSAFQGLYSWVYNSEAPLGGEWKQTDSSERYDNWGADVGYPSYPIGGVSRGYIQNYGDEYQNSFKQYVDQIRKPIGHSFEESVRNIQTKYGKSMSDDQRNLLDKLLSRWTIVKEGMRSLVHEQQIPSTGEHTQQSETVFRLLDMMSLHVPAEFRKSDASNYLLSIPNFPAYVTEGLSLEKAITGLTAIPAIQWTPDMLDQPSNYIEIIGKNKDLSQEEKSTYLARLSDIETRLEGARQIEKAVLLNQLELNNQRGQIDELSKAIMRNGQHNWKAISQLSSQFDNLTRGIQTQLDFLNSQKMVEEAERKNAIALVKTELEKVREESTLTSAKTVDWLTNSFLSLDKYLAGLNQSIEEKTDERFNQLLTSFTGKLTELKGQLQIAQADREQMEKRFQDQQSYFERVNQELVNQLKTLSATQDPSTLVEPITKQILQELRNSDKSGIQRSDVLSPSIRSRNTSILSPVPEQIVSLRGASHVTLPPIVRPKLQRPQESAIQQASRSKSLEMQRSSILPDLSTHKPLIGEPIAPPKPIIKKHVAETTPPVIPKETTLVAVEDPIINSLKTGLAVSGVFPLTSRDVLVDLENQTHPAFLEGATTETFTKDAYRRGREDGDPEKPYGGNFPFSLHQGQTNPSRKKKSLEQKQNTAFDQAVNTLRESVDKFTQALHNDTRSIRKAIQAERNRAPEQNDNIRLLIEAMAAGRGQGGGPPLVVNNSAAGGGGGGGGAAGGPSGFPARRRLPPKKKRTKRRSTVTVRATRHTGHINLSKNSFVSSLRYK